MLEQVQGIPWVLIHLVRQVSPHDLVMGGIDPGSPLSPDSPCLSGLSAWACTPKPRSVCLLWTILHSSDINGGLSLTTFLWGQQLRALVNNSPGHNRVFQSKPLWWLSSLPDRFVQTPAAMHMIVYGLPTMRGTGSLWYSKNLEPFRELRSY